MILLIELSNFTKQNFYINSQVNLYINNRDENIKLFSRLHKMIYRNKRFKHINNSKLSVTCIRLIINAPNYYIYLIICRIKRSINDNTYDFL